MNVDDSDVIEYLLNDNWMYINKYYTKVELDQLRAKVMPETINDINKHIKIERFCNDFFKSR